MTVTTLHIPHTHTHISTCTQGNAQKTAMHTGFRKLCTAAVNVDIVFTEQIKEKKSYHLKRSRYHFSNNKNSDLLH